MKITEQNLTFDHTGGGDAAVQVNGSDLVHISDLDDDGTATVTVFTSHDPNASVAWTGRVQVVPAPEPKKVVVISYEGINDTSDGGFNWFPAEDREGIEAHWARSVKDAKKYQQRIRMYLTEVSGHLDGQQITDYLDAEFVGNDPVIEPARDTHRYSASATTGERNQRGQEIVRTEVLRQAGDRVDVVVQQHVWNTPTLDVNIVGEFGEGLGELLIRLNGADLYCSDPNMKEHQNNADVIAFTAADLLRDLHEGGLAVNLRPAQRERLRAQCELVINAIESIEHGR